MKNLLFIFLIFCLNQSLFAQIQPINDKFATRESYFYSGKVKTVTENEIDAKTQKSKFKYKLQFNKQGYLFDKNYHFYSKNNLDNKYEFLKFDSLKRPTLIKEYLVDFNNTKQYIIDSLFIVYDEIQKYRIEKTLIKKEFKYIDTFEINTHKIISIKDKYFYNVTNFDSLIQLYPKFNIQNILKKGNTEYLYSKYEGSLKFSLKEEKRFNEKKQLISNNGTYYDTLGRIILIKYSDESEDSSETDSNFINMYQKFIYTNNGKIGIFHKCGVMTTRIDSLWYNKKDNLIKMKSVNCPPHDYGLVSFIKGKNGFQYHLTEYYDVFFNSYLGHNYDPNIIITQTFDYDYKGNWITSKLYADNKLVKIYKREICYWD